MHHLSPCLSSYRGVVVLKMMVISDLHYEKVFHRGVDESKAWNWLLSIVNYHEPDVLLSCGDWGTAITAKEFKELLSKTTVLTIYGNHDNLDVLRSLRNVNAALPVLMEDGLVYNVGGVRVAGISGVVAKKRKGKKRVPRKTPEDFIDLARKLKDERVDVLLIHETPYLPRVFSSIRKSLGSQVALEAIEIIKPKIVFNGHIHEGTFRTYVFPYNTLYVYIDSSQHHKAYLILHVDNGLLEIWVNYEKKLNIPIQNIE